MLDKSDASSLAHLPSDTRIFATVANTTLAVLLRYLSSTDGDLDLRRRTHLTKSRTPSHVDNGVAARMRQVLMGGINGSLLPRAIGIGSGSHGTMIGSRNALVMSVLLKLWKVSEMLVQNKGQKKTGS